jgi:hypothetical protein
MIDWRKRHIQGWELQELPQEVCHARCRSSLDHYCIGTRVLRGLAIHLVWRKDSSYTTDSRDPATGLRLFELLFGKLFRGLQHFS